jgi:methionyl-tRNA formyltransferase
MAFTRLARRVGRDFRRLWDAAKPQGEGSFWGLTSDDERVLDFNTPVADILRRVRAFGLTETIAKVGEMTLYVRRAVGWSELHAARPGDIVQSDGRRLVIAARDGYIGLIEWSPISLLASEAVGRTNLPG